MAADTPAARSGVFCLRSAIAVAGLTLLAGAGAIAATTPKVSGLLLVKGSYEA